MARLIFPLKLSNLVFLVFCVSCTPIEKTPIRSMTVTGGPERVFDRPLGDILPQLRHARPTGINGRVGNELVFWGYQLQDDQKLNFYGCAQLHNVDCDERMHAICPDGGKEIARAIEPGGVRHVNCRAIGIVGTGDLLPNCQDEMQTNDVLVGLMQCR